MTTTQEPTNALATREFTDKQIRTRIEAAKGQGFGLNKATPAQLNMIYMLASHYDVDPAIDITLLFDHPTFTIDGRIRLMRRHPQYRGYATRPLSAAEKEAWGYKSQEIVVECTIRTKDWGEIVARGKVSPDEFGRQPVAKSHPQEMAEKRAIARASRMAFGQDVPDEDDVGAYIIEQNDPKRVALKSAEYGRIFGKDEDHAFAEPQFSVNAGGDVVDTSTGEVLQRQAQEPETKPEPPRMAPPADPRRGELLEMYGALLTQARHSGAIAEGDVSRWVLGRDVSTVQIIARSRDLRAVINAHQLALSTAATTPPPATLDSKLVETIDDVFYQAYALKVAEAVALGLEYTDIELPITVKELTRLGKALASTIAAARRDTETAAVV